MPSTFAGRYNKETNSLIDLNAVSGNTSIGLNMGAYRGKSGVPDSGPVSFSNLRGMYNTSNIANRYAVPGQSTSDNSYEDYWIYASYKSTAYGSGYYTSWYVGGTFNGDYRPHTQLSNWLNPDTGQYLWSYAATWFSPWPSPRGNTFIGGIFNRKYHIFAGDMQTSGTERALAFGYIHLKLQTPGGASVAGLSLYNPFNLLMGQKYQTSVDLNIELGLFRTTSRSYMKGVWITGGSTYIGTLFTSPFSSGAALSASSSYLVLSSSTSRHINNTIGMAWGCHFFDGIPGGYYPVLGFHDVGLRNARFKSTAFNTSVWDPDVTDNTDDVNPFET